MKRITMLILSCILLTNCSIEKNKSCYLTGKVIDRNSKTLILLKQTEDANYCGINIPIDSAGNFNYQLNLSFVEAYLLIFKDEHDMGAWKPITFFPDNDTIQFILCPMEKADSNKIIGSRLSLKENKLNQLLRTIFEKQAEYLLKAMDSITDGNDSVYKKQISDKLHALYKESIKWTLRYIGNNEVNIFGYSKFLQILQDETQTSIFPIDTLNKYYVLFRQKFPGHPYNSISQNMIYGLVNIKVGGFYVDFTAPDSNGTSIKLSDFISKNKLTLIDLWAPWCAPCIRKSKNVVPIFEEFKGSGFGVIGVVGGIRNKEQFQNAIRKHPYPWPLLSEISDESKIWEKYSISNSGGSQFLVDRQGKILAINPSPDELKELILKE